MKNMKQMNGLVRAAKILVFVGLLLIMGFIGLLWFLRPDTSTVEKRALTEFPHLTWSDFWDGTFFKGVDTWYADTYPMREVMISANQSFQGHYGLRSDQIVGNTIVADEIPDAPQPGTNAPAASPVPIPSPSPLAEAETETELEDGTVDELGEMVGQIYITNNCGYGLYYFTQSGADAYAATMNQIYDRVKDKVNLYVMLCPISAGIMLDEAVLEDMGCSDEGKAIEYVYSQLDEGIHAVNPYDTLRAHNAEYLYFHTDHHWTQLGAYYAYTEFCKEKGITPHKLEDFETVEFDNFVGTFYSYSNQSAEIAANPDTVIAYVPNGTNDMKMTMASGETWDWNIVYDVSDYPNSEYYGTYVGGDRPFSVAHNETITDGSAVMVIKDSYGNAFIPWLIDHYEYIYWCDYRYTSNTISQMVEDYGIQDVIYECSIHNGTSTNVLPQFAAIGQ